MKRILLPAALFAIYLGIVGLGTGAKRNSLLAKSTDLTLICMYLAFIAILSILTLRERWGDPQRPQSRPTVLRRIRAWVTDDRTDDRTL